MKFGYCLAAALALSAVAGWGGPARAAIMPYTQLDQSRQIDVSVSASGTIGGTPVSEGASESSNATGSFFRTMDYQVTAQAPPPGVTGASASGSAGQNVVFGDTAIFGTVGIHVTAAHNGGTSHSRANSQFSTHFTVAQDTPFNLDGQINLSSSGLGAVGQYVEQFVLSGQGPAPGQFESFVAVAQSGGIGGSLFPLQASGVFHPGWTYTLSVQLLGDKTTDGGAGATKIVTGQADFVLTVPEPAGVTLAAVGGAALLLSRRRRAGR